MKKKRKRRREGIYRIISCEGSIVGVGVAAAVGDDDGGGEWFCEATMVPGQGAAVRGVDREARNRGGNGRSHCRGRWYVAMAGIELEQEQEQEIGAEEEGEVF